MGLTAWLLRHTPIRPLLVTAPGNTATRLAAERYARLQGWIPAGSPAEANLLAIAAHDGSALEPFTETVWHSIPAPRARVVLTSPNMVEAALKAAAEELRDLGTQRARAAAQPPEPAPMEHDEHAHAGHDMGGMEMPGGIPMADRAPDRDGLRLDVLHVPLGPILPCWPSGLIVHTELQGDVIQSATVDLAGSGLSGDQQYWSDTGTEGVRRSCGRKLDSCAKLLAVAGWDTAASQAVRLRDEVLAGATDQSLLAAFERWERRVRRSQVLRWSLRDLGVLPGDVWADTGLDGDAADRLRRWLDSARQSVEQLTGRNRPHAAETEGPHVAEAVLEALPSLLSGVEFADARLLIASLDPDTDRMATSRTHHHA